MAFSNFYMCRGLTPLLNDNDNPTNQQIIDNISDIDGKISLWIASRYFQPIQPIAYLSGTITVNKDSTDVSGTSTSFTDLKPNDVIQIVKTGEVIQIERIDSDTSFKVFNNVISDSEDSEFWVIPQPLVTASKYLSTHITLMLYFPEKTVSQDNVEKFDRRLEYFAGDIIKMLKSGNYINPDLKTQARANNTGRYLKVFESDNKTANDTFISNVLNFS